MAHHYRKRTVKLLVVILLIFTLIFFVSLRYFMAGSSSSIFSIGIPGENLAVMLLSVVAMGKVVYELYSLEADSAE